MWIGLGVVIALIIVYYYLNDREMYYTSGLTVKECPSQIEYDKKIYDHLLGFDITVGKSDKSGNGCEDGEVTHCRYGIISSKKMNDGKKFGLIWRTQPVCGQDFHNKTATFAEKNDFVNLVYRDITNPQKKKLIHAGKTSCKDCSNKCYDKYGLSVDRSFMDNGSLVARDLNNLDMGKACSSVDEFKTAADANKIVKILKE